MQFEVEIKAWVRDLPELESRLRHIGGAVSQKFDKADKYFRYREKSRNQDVRIREVSDQSFVTFKDKTLSRGLEVNKEYEFSVSDSEAMQELLLRLGAQFLVEKRKLGRSWKIPGRDLNIEISDVVGLGNFIEVESIVDPEGLLEKQKDAAISQSESEIRELLSILGINENDIETRTYTSMLLGQK